MGGNAIKNSVRLTKESYFKLWDEISNSLTQLQKQYTFDYKLIQAYRNKSDFGDMDILITTNQNINLNNILLNYFNINNYFKNSNVLSVDYNQFQIDFIFINSSQFNFAYNYYSWNDLGNLYGRLAHKMGFKFGHDGLWYIVREENNTHNVISEILVTDNYEEALSFLNISFEENQKGFDNLEDIFDHVINLPYFNSDLYPLEHRNHQARVRDKKRKTYMSFLKYIQKMDLEEEYVFWPKCVYLVKAFNQFPKFKLEHDFIVDRYKTKRLAKINFNGNNVTEWTGLTGKDLGYFMTLFLHHLNNDLDESYKLISEMDVDTLKSKIENFQKLLGYN